MAQTKTIAVCKMNAPVRPLQGEGPAEEFMEVVTDMACQTTIHHRIPTSYVQGFPLPPAGHALRQFMPFFQ